MYLLLNVINCIFNIVVIVWLSASSPSLDKSVNLPKSLSFVRHKVYFFAIFKETAYNSVNWWFHPLSRFDGIQMYICAPLPWQANQIAEWKYQPITALYFPHSLTNGDAACESRSSHRSPQCCSQPATSQLTSLLIEKYGWHDDTSKQVGALFRHMCCRHRYYIFLGIYVFCIILPRTPSLALLTNL